MITYIWYVKEKNTHFIETENRISVARGWGGGDRNDRDAGQRAQTFNCRENKF